MLLTLTAQAQPPSLPDSRDIGFLLHKNPSSLFSRELTFGTAQVFYPEATPECTTVALLVEVDPIRLVRGRADSLFQYVCDRPYAASSFLSVALSECFSTALSGRSKERPELASTPLTLSATLAALACDAGEPLIRRLLEPLGYEITLTRYELDSHFPQWGSSNLYTVTLTGEQTVHNLLSHLYVLIPALDNAKHYFVGEEEVEKLLRHGEGWLATHPERELIARRYLRYKRNLTSVAMERLSEGEPEIEQEVATEEILEKPVRLNDQRVTAAAEAVQSLMPPAQTLIDLGCGEGTTLRTLKSSFPSVALTGMDVSSGVLAIAERRLHGNVPLLHGSLVYSDSRLQGFDMALLMEVIEHLDPERLTALENSVFRHAAPRRVFVTTPNAEYNALWPSLPAGKFRHGDHRFEWTRAEFREWAERVAVTHGYTVAFGDVGEADPTHGAPTQSATFDR
ncbi:3' terminal RNA ribose 2'-O-methyltransferase Hen1 [Armatimonas sp.]|uniref:3' terminal RNA ribose 2'-O-methyltransferase Hen1 n=1 Tax=Armatimonas sp. TaxID=1872638 RepID=UPI00286BE46F|nr:3' terminal RNA ribose 2'-O-methyltransferase Hen1 [Armatimonas sp.]